jgi:hypothetical protein
MSHNEIQQRLTSALQSDNLYLGSAELVDELEKAGASGDVITPILRFIEAHPKADFGARGPLVHFVESFYHRGYEEELLKSLRRKPTSHTLRMLNAMVNGAKDDGERNRYMDVFREALTHPGADDWARETAARYLRRAQEING